MVALYLTSTSKFKFQIRHVISHEFCQAAPWLSRNGADRFPVVVRVPTGPRARFKSGITRGQPAERQWATTKKYLTSCAMARKCDIKKDTKDEKKNNAYSMMFALVQLHKATITIELTSTLTN